MTHIKVIIPAYNEQDSIANVIHDIPKIVNEIIVVNNNSTDNTEENAKHAGATVLTELNKGYGYACLKGMDYIAKQDNKPDIIVFLPCGFDIKKTKDEVDNLIIKNNEWRNLKAFKNKNLFIVDGNQYFNRPGPRLIESLEIFAEIFQPKLFNFNHEKSGWINYLKKLS